MGRKTEEKRNLSNKRILVFGADGMLGSTLVPYFVGLGYNVFPTDIIGDSDVTDIRKFDQVKIKIRDVEPDMVLHLAAETDVDKCEIDPDHAFLVNTIGTQNVALSCQQYDIPMVYISTLGVFDGKKRTPYTEFDTPNPINVYGMSKLEGEKIVQSLLKKYYIVRAGWMIGGGSKRDKKFIAKIINQLDTKKKIEVVNDKIGSLTYALDFSRCLGNLIKTGYYGLYHCTNKGVASRYDVAKKIVEYLGREDIEIAPVNSAHFPLPALRADSEACRNYKLELLGLDIMRPWEEALEEYIKKEWMLYDKPRIS